MVRSYNFLAPSLHPNTLLDIAIPEPGPSREPIVKHLAIKHGEYESIGLIKRISNLDDGNVIVADDAFRISTLSISTDQDEPAPPRIFSQHTTSAQKGSIWSGLIPVASGTISSLTSGQLTFHPIDTTLPIQSRTVPSPILCLSSTSNTATTFALAGKEVDVSIWDIERTFTGTSSDVTMNGGKRKKDILEDGETWRAKNMPINSLRLRPPIHHLCLAHLPGSGTSLVSGTKAGTVRRYDTRQRKPVGEYKIAREGGIGAVAPGRDEHELFFGDRSNFLGASDLRTGRLLHSYPHTTSSAHHLISLPSTSSDTSNLPVGLASISSDATLRLHTTLPDGIGGKGNRTVEGKKPGIVGMVGGVGVGSFVWRGMGEVEEDKVEKAGEEEDGGDDSDEEDDAGVWDGMGEVEDDGSESEEEELVQAKKVKR